MRGSPMRRRLFLEGLESRRLLTAAGGSAELEGGVLSIAGSEKNDWIHVSLTDTVLTVQVNKQSYQFTAADVASIEIDGSKGNDTICLDQGVLAGATIDGGAGNDRLHGGGGNDTLSGGDGNDRLFGGAGLDELWGDAGHDKLDGGEEDDVLEGGLGKDHLRGGAGNDQLFGNENKDHLWGGDGDDELLGGDDKDHLWGDLGDDSLKGESGNDHLDGGLGTNVLDGDEGRNKFKNGQVVDLDAVTPGLVAHLNDSSGQGIVGVARYETLVENGESVQRLTITVENVPPPQSGEPTQLRVVLGELWLGDLTVDPTTGSGTFTFTGVEILDGYFISLGTSLSGAFAPS